MTLTEDDLAAGAEGWDDAALEQDPTKVLAYVRREAAKQATAARAEWKADGWQRAEQLEAENHRLRVEVGEQRGAQRPSQPRPAQPREPSPPPVSAAVAAPRAAQHKPRGPLGAALGSIVFAGGVAFLLIGAPHFVKTPPVPTTVGCPVHAKPGYYKISSGEGPIVAYCSGSLFDTPKGNPDPSVQQVENQVAHTTVPDPAASAASSSTTYTTSSTSSTSSTAPTAPVSASTQTLSNAQVIAAQQPPYPNTPNVSLPNVGGTEPKP